MHVILWVCRFCLILAFKWNFLVPCLCKHVFVGNGSEEAPRDWRGFQCSPASRHRRQQTPIPEARTKPRRMKTWLIYLTSLEEAEPYGWDRQTCDLSPFVIIAFSYFVISIAFWHYLLPIIMSIVIELNMPLLLSVIYCIVSNFTASGILSYILCDGLSETPKIEVLCTFIRTPFSIKCNLGYQPCPGFKLFLNLLLRKIDWKK